MGDLNYGRQSNNKELRRRDGGHRCGLVPNRCQIRGREFLELRIAVHACSRCGYVCRLQAGAEVAGKFPARIVVLLHLLAFALATGVGWSLAEGTLPPRDVDAVWLEATAIAGHNVRTVCVLAIASLTTGGVAGLVLFGANGYAFGAMLGMAPLAKVHWVLLYAPFEVAAFTVASVTATQFSWMVGRWLREDAPVSGVGSRVGVTATIVAGTLAGAAILEALAIHWAWSND